MGQKMFIDPENGKHLMRKYLTIKIGDDEEDIDCDYSNLIATLKGRRKVNPNLAIKAGRIFNISPAIWLHIESKNELSTYLKTAPSYEGYSLVELLK